MLKKISNNNNNFRVIIKNISEKNATLLKEKDGHIEKLLSS
jgi:hypothetical protein